MRKRSHIRAVMDAQGSGDSADTAMSPSPETAEDGAEDAFEQYGEAPGEEIEWIEEEAPAADRGWIAPVLALSAVAGWTGFFGWASWPAMSAGAAPAQWAGWIVSWSVPVILLVALWLLALRNSARESKRFGEIAYMLSNESARLEERLVTVNRELSLAREFLATQTRELDFLGRNATERISEHADHLQALVRSNGDQVEAIARVSTTAKENMDRLRDNLPVIANSARDVSNQIGAAGHGAQEQLEELVAGFARLNEFGAASERQVLSLRKRVDDALAAFSAQADQLGTVAAQRFADLRANSEAFRTELDGREIEVLAAIRGRADGLRAELAETQAQAAEDEEAALAAVRERMTVLRDEAADLARGIREGEDVAIAAWSGQIEQLRTRLSGTIENLQQIDARALDAANAKLTALREEAETVDARLAERNALFQQEILRRRAELDADEEQAGIRLSERLAALDREIAERRESQLAQMAMLAEHGEALGERIAELGTRVETVAAQGSEAGGELERSVATLNATLTESREALDGTDMAVAALTDASVRLLELIQASARHSRDDLPVAMEASEQRLAAIEHRADEVRALLDQAKAAGEALSLRMDDAETRARQAMDAVEGFQSRFGETAAAQVDSIEKLRSGVAALGDESRAVAERTQGELRDAIAALETSAREALSAIETEQADRIERIAATVGEKSASAIDRAVEEHSAEAIAKLDEATAQATQASREAMLLLRNQLARVNELTANLENRVMRAREQAEEKADNDFSRRIALITESLNSNAIDIGKALSTEVTDIAWASYLRGDRGIFTRRAVRLLDNTEAREIAELYDADHEFREHVNRYIHDFEAMLRTMLSTRDGNALSVTLLSSDMGKLYVALAQAIERLRE